MFKTFFYQSHREQRRVVTTVGKEAKINKIEISNPKISLINCIGTPPNSPSKNKLSIEDSGVNIHLAKQSTKKIPLS